MPQIIAFTSPKGGCGSTFACALVCYMLSRQDCKVLAVDMCFERGTLDLALGFQNDYIYTLRDAAEGGCTLSEAICSFGGISFSRCGYEFDYLDYDDIGQLFKNSDYDYIVIDMPSYQDEIRDGVISFADMLVLVTDASPISQRLCDMYMQQIDFDDTMIIVNKIIPSYIKTGVHMTVDEILDAVGVPLLGLIPWTPDADAAFCTGFSQGIDNSSLSRAFLNIALRLKGEKIPALDIDKEYDCFKKNRAFFKNRI